MRSIAGISLIGGGMDGGTKDDGRGLAQSPEHACVTCTSLSDDASNLTTSWS